MAKFQHSLKEPKATNEHAKRVMAEARKLGYEIVATKGTGHMKFIHKSGAIVFGPATPSDNRSQRNTISNLRRSLRQLGVEI